MRNAIRRACAALLCMAVALPLAASPSLDALQAAIQVVDDRMDVAYDEVLAQYDAEIAAAPGDAARMVARCEFIAAFTDHDTGRYVVGAPEAFSACLDALAPRAGDDPLARVYLFEQGHLDAVEGEADAILAAADAWPDHLHARVAAELSWDADDDVRAGEMAVLATTLGDARLVARAVTHHVDQGDRAAALALLDDSPAPQTQHAAEARMDAALLLAKGGSTAAQRRAGLAELHRQDAAGRTVDDPRAARAHLYAGDAAAAQALAADGDDDAADTLRYDIAVARRDWAAAATHVDLLRTDGFDTHLARFAAVVTAAPATLLMPALWPSLGVAAAAALAVALACMLLPGALLVPVHYRGAIRRLSLRAPVPLFHSVGLRHAWLAAAAMLAVPMAVLGIADPSALVAMLTGAGVPAGRTLVMMILWGSVVAIAVVAVPVSRMAAAGDFGWKRLHRSWWRVLLAWAVVLSVGALIGLVHQGSGAHTETDQIRMVADMVTGGRTPMEALLAFVAVALLGPLWEEIAFRGLLLGGMARHISFGWANALQATAFALVHGDPPRFLYYLAMGLMTGWLVRQTRSLAPAIALHMLANTLAFFLISR